MAGNFLEHCRTEMLSSENRARIRKRQREPQRSNDMIRWARWDSNPRPDAPQASALSKLCNGSTDKIQHCPVIIHFRNTEKNLCDFFFSLFYKDIVHYKSCDYSTNYWSSPVHPVIVPVTRN